MSGNNFEVYSPPQSVPNRFTWLPHSISLSAFYSLSFSYASKLDSHIWLFIWLVASSIKSNTDQPPLMAVSRKMHMSQWMYCRGMVAWGVTGVKGSQDSMIWMQHLQSNYLVIPGVSVIIGMISNLLRLTSAGYQCNHIHFSPLCRDARPVVLFANSQLSLLVLVYLVNSRTQPRIYPEWKAHRPEVQCWSTCHGDCWGWHRRISLVQLWHPTPWSETGRSDWMIPGHAPLLRVWSCLSFHPAAGKST